MGGLDDLYQQLILDHYRGESQTLTTGTEANFLKFKELIGDLTESELKRWNEIKKQCKCARATVGKALDRFYEKTGFSRPDRKGGFNGRMYRLDENRDAAKPIPEDEVN
jgi:hypothetical protein